jgi:pre-peptidase
MRAARSAQSRVFVYLTLLPILILAAGTAQGAWIASGTFKYQDREFDETGFTGATPLLPIRYAKVEVRYLKGGGGSTLLATGATDVNGNYSISVTDTSTRDIFIRVLTTSGVPDLFLQVTNILSPVAVYAVTTPTYTAHAPVNLNAGLIIAVPGSGGEVFNLFDVGLNTEDYLAYLNGSRPGSSQQLTIQWENGVGTPTNSYIGNNTIRAADNSGYNDTVIQHESGHYAVANFSGSDNPGGVHHLTNCRQDLRLAFDEGFATYFGQSVRRYFNLPNPQLYVKTTGGAGPGNLDFYFDVETMLPYVCNASTSEVTVYAALWDIVDSATTPDRSPGVEEAFDSMAGADQLIWSVMRNYIPAAANKSVEDFWDGWFVLGEGSESSMKTLFVQHGMEFVNDLGESNETTATATPVPSNGIPFHATYFKDTGNGAGSADTDYFQFAGLGGTVYQIDTRNLVGDANTSLVLLATDGVTVIASNDDRTAGDPSSFISFTAPISGSYFIRSIHGPGLGIYGSYDIAVTGTVFLGGASLALPARSGGALLREPITIDGESPGGNDFLTAPE